MAVLHRRNIRMYIRKATFCKRHVTKTRNLLALATTRLCTGYIKMISSRQKVNAQRYHSVSLAIYQIVARISPFNHCHVSPDREYQCETLSFLSFVQSRSQYCHPPSSMSDDTIIIYDDDDGQIQYTSGPWYPLKASDTSNSSWQHGTLSGIDAVGSFAFNFSGECCMSQAKCGIS